MLGDGVIDSERMAIAGLNLAHAHLTLTATRYGIKPYRIPKLADFVPEPPSAEPEQPRDIESWAHSLLAAFSG